jgi:hypothetical protein
MSENPYTAPQSRPPSGLTSMVVAQRWRLIPLLIGVTGACVGVTTLRFVREIVFPVFSGVGPLSVFRGLPALLLLSALIALIGIAAGKLLRYSPPSSYRATVGFGAACGLSSTFQLATPWAPEIPALILAVVVALALALLSIARGAAG